MAALAVAKAVACAGLAFAVGSAFGLDRTYMGILVVQLATPVAVRFYLLAVKYGADSAPMAAPVVVSAALSVAVLPVLLAFFVRSDWQAGGICARVSPNRQRPGSDS